MANRRVAGHHARAWGILFEQAFELRCRQSCIAVTRIPDSCKQVGGGKIIRAKSPYDWVSTYKGRSLFCDTKTTLDNSFAHSAIDENQVDCLIPHERAGAMSGYLIWLREHDQVIFVSASILQLSLQFKGSIKATTPNTILLGNHREFDLKKLFST